MGVIGHGHRGLAVDGHGVDHGQQQTVVLLLIGAAHGGAHLEGDDVGVRGRLDGDLLLRDHRCVLVGDEALSE